jgi:predicted metal-dependent phosphotriesterase family hydrolase
MNFSIGAPSSDESFLAIFTLMDLSSDMGQSMNPTPTDALRDFITQLMNKGITQEQIDSMTRKNPARLLGLEKW